MLKQRIQILQLLPQKLSVRAIAQQVGVGTDTVMRMARKLQSSAKLRGYFLKPLKPSTSKWIFGQVGGEE